MRNTGEARVAAAGVGGANKRSGPRGGGGSGAQGGRKEMAGEQSPAGTGTDFFMTPRDSGKGKRKESKSPADNDRTMRTPVRRLSPESGSSSFLYEAGTSSCPAILEPAPDEGHRCQLDAVAGEAGDGGRRGRAACSNPAAASAAAPRGTEGAAISAAEQEDLRVGPAFAACRQCSRSVGLATTPDTDVLRKGHGISSGGGRNVFEGGAAAVADFYFAWRQSRCFSFVLGSRDLHWLGDSRGGRGGGGGAGAGAGGRDRRSWEYRRSWEALAASVALPVAPYTVPSAGEGGVPLSQRGKEES